MRIVRLTTEVGEAEPEFMRLQSGSEKVSRDRSPDRSGHTTPEWASRRRQGSRPAPDVSFDLFPPDPSGGAGEEDRVDPNVPDHSTQDGTHLCAHRGTEVVTLRSWADEPRTPSPRVLRPGVLGVGPPEPSGTADDDPALRGRNLLDPRTLSETIRARMSPVLGRVSEPTSRLTKGPTDGSRSRISHPTNPTQKNIYCRGVLTPRCLSSGVRTEKIMSTVLILFRNPQPGTKLPLAFRGREEIHRQGNFRFTSRRVWDVRLDPTRTEGVRRSGQRVEGGRARQSPEPKPGGYHQSNVL